MVYARLFKTSIGNTVLKPEESVFSQVDGGYFEKPARDANVGESVLFETEYVAASLDEVEPVLRLSDRYATAEQMLHETNSRGAIIPRLRTNLIRGFASRGVIQEDNLEEKILRENERDVSPESYRRMIYHTSELLNRTGDGKHEDTIREWLTGDTLSPREWHIYGILRQINPEFEAYDAANTSRAGILYNYKLYTKIRSGIMRYLVNPRAPRHHAKGPPQGPDLTDSLEREIQLVFEHFVREVDAKHAAAQILEITDLEKRSQWAERARKEPRLRKGVLTERNEITERNKKSVEDILAGRNTYLDFFSAIVKATMPKSMKQPLPIPSTNIESREKMEWDISSSFFITLAIDKYMGIKGEQRFRAEFTPIIDLMINHFGIKGASYEAEKYVNSIFDGEVDKKIGFPTGSVAKLLGLLKGYHRSVPASIHKFQYLIGEYKKSSGGFPGALSFAENGQSLKRKIEKLVDNIHTEYPCVEKETSPLFKMKIINIGKPEYVGEQREEFLERNGLSCLIGFERSGQLEQLLKLGYGQEKPNN